MIEIIIKYDTKVPYFEKYNFTQLFPDQKLNYLYINDRLQIMFKMQLFVSSTKVIV